MITATLNAVRAFYDDLSVSIDLTWLDTRALRRRFAFMAGQRASMYRHLASQLANEITVEKALSKYETRLLKRNRTVAASIVSDIGRRYANGKNLANALEGFIPVSELVLIASGERSGTLPEIIERMLEANESVRKIQRVLISAMVPPLAYLIAIYVLLATIGNAVLPSLIQTGTNLSGVRVLGLVVIALGRFVTSPAVVIPPFGTVGMVYLTIWSLPRWTGPLRRRADQFFPFSYYRDTQGYTWLLAFSGMLAAMDIKQALDEQIKYASAWLKERLVRIRWLYGEASRPFGDALIESKFEFPNPDLIDDIDSLSEFPDFSRRINVRAMNWAKELEFGVSSRVIWGALIFEFLIFILIGALQQGITDITNAMTIGFN